MYKLIIFLIGTIFTFRSDGQTTSPDIISIKWKNNIRGDYSFKDKWDYNTGIFRNEYGQLICDGLCPDESFKMLDSAGRIYRDSVTSYYNLIDTTHQFHTIDCNAWCYEFAGADYVNVIRKSTDSIFCYTMSNPATHCSLNISIGSKYFCAWIELNSIVQGGYALYKCNSGKLMIDKKLWKLGIMKAEFSFDFEHKKNPKQPMFWKGKIYTKIIQAQ